jgi:hypothetical protein
VHAAAEATFLCRRCGSFGCEACLFSPVEGREVCDACAAQGLGEAIPWERRKTLGTWKAFWATVRLASRSPRAFFRTPTTQASVLPALIHGVASFTVGLFSSYVLAGLLVMLGGGVAAVAVPEDQGGPVLGGLLGMYGCVITGMSPIALLFGPANALMGLVVAAAASHGVLSLLGKTGASFEDTLRAVAYANAPYVWSWVPLLGGFTWFWMVGLEVVALRETHRCGSDAAALAAIGYRVALVLALVLGYAAFVGGFLVLLRGRA